MPNQSPIERLGLAGRAFEVRKPAAILPIRLMGASAATGLAMLICVLVAPAVQLRAQTGTGDSSKPGDEYNLSYDDAAQESSPPESSTNAEIQTWNWHVQNTDIVQGDPGFVAKYSGP